MPGMICAIALCTEMLRVFSEMIVYGACLLVSRYINTYKKHMTYRFYLSLTVSPWRVASKTPHDRLSMLIGIVVAYCLYRISLCIQEPWLLKPNE